MKQSTYFLGAPHPIRILPIVVGVLMFVALAPAAWSAGSSQLAANKRLVVAFYDAAINKKDYDLAVGDSEYIDNGAPRGAVTSRGVHV